jgi:hypothetical protein
MDFLMNCKPDISESSSGPTDYFHWILDYDFGHAAGDLCVASRRSNEKPKPQALELLFLSRSRRSV